MSEKKETKQTEPVKSKKKRTKKQAPDLGPERFESTSGLGGEHDTKPYSSFPDIASDNEKW